MILPKHLADTGAALLPPPDNAPYALIGASAVFDMGTRISVYVLDANNTPRAGVTVVNARPDGKYEALQTNGAGNVEFIMGAGSRFFLPQTGAHTVGVATVDNERIVWQSERVSGLGLPDGHHAEVVLTFKQVPTQDTPPTGNGGTVNRETLRQMAAHVRAIAAMLETL